jgi:hypothetical protein
MFVEKLDVPLSLTFDDVLLEPRESWLEPAEADTRSKFSKTINLKYTTRIRSDGHGYRSPYGYCTCA